MTGKVVLCSSVRKLLRYKGTDFPEIYESPQNSGRQKDDKKFHAEDPP
jgi:hypothetical protein